MLILVNAKKNGLQPEIRSFYAADRGRTGTDFTPRDFKSLVSAYSTTAANIKLTLRLYYTFQNLSRLIPLLSNKNEPIQSAQAHYTYASGEN